MNMKELLKQLKESLDEINENSDTYSLEDEWNDLRDYFTNTYNDYMYVIEDKINDILRHNNIKNAQVQLEDETLFSNLVPVFLYGNKEKHEQFKDVFNKVGFTIIKEHPEKVYKNGYGITYYIVKSFLVKYNKIEV